MQTIQINTGDGASKAVPLCQFTLNPTQSIAVAGCADPETVAIANTLPGYQSKVLGSLSAQGEIMRTIIVNSLHRAGWDFIQCENPAVILVNKVGKEVGNAVN